jgi:hypothetical protein
MGQIRHTPPRPRQTVRLDNRRSSRPAHAPLRPHPTRTRPPGPPMMKPCLDCGTPSEHERCNPCQTIFNRGRYGKQTAQRKAKGGRPQYGGGWAAYSRAIRAAATICWICNEGPKPNDPWQADHLMPAQHGGGAGPARAAHRSCNIARGNRTRQTNHNATTHTPTPAPPRTRRNNPT